MTKNFEVRRNLDEEKENIINLQQEMLNFLKKTMPAPTKMQEKKKPRHYRSRDENKIDIASIRTAATAAADAVMGVIKTTEQ